MDGPPAGSRVHTAEREGWIETWDRYANERTWSILDELTAIARRHGARPAQVAIRWLSDRPGVTAPILGASTLEQLETNLGAVDLVLDRDEHDRLTAVSDVDGEYPYDGFIEGAQAGR